MILTDEQKEIVEAIRNPWDRIIRVSGPAGSGKSAIVNELKQTGKQIMFAGPTGLAAAIIGGQTVHKAFGMPSLYPLDPKKKATLQRRSDQSVRYFGGRRAEPLRKADWIVIDECSMLRCDHLDFVDSALQHARGSSEPFGGCGMVLVGDDGQLPPVATDKDAEALTAYGYRSPFTIRESRSLQGVKTYNLTRIFRQRNQSEGEIFSRIRTGRQTDLDLRIINRSVGKPHVGSVTLTPYRAIAKRINAIALQRLAGQIFEFRAAGKGWSGDNPVDSIKLKRGCRVIVKANGSWTAFGDRQTVVNGDQGTFYGLDKFGRLIIELDRGVTINLPPKTWKQYRWRIKNDKLVEEESGSFKAYPVVLGWAMTIHASQGSTLRRVFIDLPDVDPFCPALAYVALSRVESLAGLRLNRPLNHRDIWSTISIDKQPDQSELF